MMNSNRRLVARELQETKGLTPKEAYEATKGIKGRRKTDKTELGQALLKAMAELTGGTDEKNSI